MNQFIDKFSKIKTKTLERVTTRPKKWTYYWKLGLDTVRELETDDGILASGRNEVYGAIFGRDSLITSLKLLRVYQQTQESSLLPIVKKVLLTLSSLQGKEINIESGEEPGKCIHEYRPEKHEHLTKTLDKPWYVYPDNTMKNYDSVDSTSLYLITLYRYYKASKDEEFIKLVAPNVTQALNWVLTYGDSNNDGFIDYSLKSERKFGGLVNQNWMDSTEALFHEDTSALTFPIAPVEAQAYTYLALRLWSKYFIEKNNDYSEKLFAASYQLKTLFNEKFVVKRNNQTYLAAAIDGRGKKVESVRSSMGHCLWASLNLNDDGELEGIVDMNLIPKIVERLFKEDLFEKEAGIRTLSKLSREYKPQSYHNGSIWPHDNSIIAEGLENYGYQIESVLIKKALLKTFAHFKTPIELFVFDKTYHDYLSPSGQASCKQQAWSAAAILNAVAKDYSFSKQGKLPKLHQFTSKAVKWLFVYNV